MLVETEVLRSTAPMRSAIDMKRLPKTSSRTGSGRARSAGSGRARPASSRSTRSPSGPSSAANPGSRTSVPVSSSTSAGPRRRWPGTSASRAKTGASRRPAPGNQTASRRSARGTSARAPAPSPCTARPTPGALPPARAPRRAVAIATARPGPGARVAEARGVLGGEGPGPVAVSRLGDRERGLGAGVAQVERAHDAHARVLRALRGESGARLALELAPRGSYRVRELRAKRHAPGVALPVPAELGARDAPGREHARERVEEDGRDAELARERAGVLAGRAAEADERAVARVDPARDRHLGDRLRHARVGDGDEARGEGVAAQVVAGARELPFELPERGEGGAGAEREREAGGMDPPERRAHRGQRGRARLVPDVPRPQRAA